MSKSVGSLKQLLRLALVVFVVTSTTFVLLDIAPGDPAALKAGFGATETDYQNAVAELGLDKPLAQRYFTWVSNVIRGDFGQSWVIEGFSVTELLSQVLPQTLELIILAELIALSTTITLCLFAASRPGSFIDRFLSAASLALFSTPVFVLGITLSYLFGVKLSWFPTIVSDLEPLFSNPLANLRQMLLPALVLALGLIGIYIPILRRDLSETLSQDYIMMARARGISDGVLLRRHALIPSMLNLLTAFGLNLASLLAGTFVIEVLFAVNGVGRLLIHSVLAQDYPVVTACVSLISVTYVLVNSVVDAIYRRLDPRLAHV